MIIVNDTILLITDQYTHTRYAWLFIYYSINVEGSLLKHGFYLEPDQEKLRSPSKVCSVLPQVFWLCFIDLTLTFADMLLSLSLCFLTVNYCFASRAKSCSECLQAGKGCAYCSDEVRAENSGSVTCVLRCAAGFIIQELSAAFPRLHHFL